MWPGMLWEWLWPIGYLKSSALRASFRAQLASQSSPSGPLRSRRSVRDIFRLSESVFPLRLAASLRKMISSWISTKADVSSAKDQYRIKYREIHLLTRRYSHVQGDQQMPSAKCRASSVVFRAIATDSLAAASQLLADVHRFGRPSTSALTPARTAIPRFSAPASHDIPRSVRSRSSDDRRPTPKPRRRESASI